MSGRRGSTVFFHVGEADRVEAVMQSVLDEEGYTYGQMTRIPIARVGGAKADRWTVAIPDPPFDFSARNRHGIPLLAEVAGRLEADAFQLDVGDYSVGLLEVDSAGRYLISGLLRRWDSGDEPDTEDDGNAAGLPEGPVVALRKVLRDRDADSDERDAIALRIARSLMGPDFDPHEPDEFELVAQQEIIYRVPPPSLQSKPAQPATDPAPTRRYSIKKNTSGPSSRRAVSNSGGKKK